MKTLVQITILLIFIACKAQSPIISLLDSSQGYGQIEGAYHKDVNNFLNKFEGIWLWSEGNTTLTLQFLKIEQYQSTMPILNVNFYEDFLIGEYKYIENGVEIVNTLNLLNNSNNRDHSIWGRNLMRRMSRPNFCYECGQNEIRVKLHFRDSERNYLPSFLILRHGVYLNGQEYIIAKLNNEDSYVEPYENAPKQTRVPYGEYILLKQ